MGGSGSFEGSGVGFGVSGGSGSCVGLGVSGSSGSLVGLGVSGGGSGSLVGLGVSGGSGSLVGSPVGLGVSGSISGSLDGGSVCATIHAMIRSISNVANTFPLRLLAGPRCLKHFPCEISHACAKYFIMRFYAHQLIIPLLCNSCNSGVMGMASLRSQEVGLKARSFLFHTACQNALARHCT